MKRFGNIFAKIIDFENLKIAHKNASKGKKHYSQVKKVNEFQKLHLLNIRAMLKNRTYKVSKYNVEILNDKGKERELFKLPYYPDRIIQWAIMLQLVFIAIFGKFLFKQIRPFFKREFALEICRAIYGRHLHL